MTAKSPAPADVLQRPDQNQVHHHVRHHTDHGDTHRRLQVLTREARCQHLDQHERQHTQRVRLQRPCRLHYRLAHGAVVEQAGDHRLGENAECQCRRYAHQQHHAQRPVQSRRERLGILASMLARQARQNYRADGDAERTQRQFGQPVGVIERRRCRFAGRTLARYPAAD